MKPVAWMALLKEADELVRTKPTWVKFIDGTPLANDIAVWMADFAEAQLKQAKAEALREAANELARRFLNAAYTVTPTEELRRMADEMEVKCQNTSLT